MLSQEESVLLIQQQPEEACLGNPPNKPKAVHHSESEDNERGLDSRSVRNGNPRPTSFENPNKGKQ